jgi:nucleotide-binding universal stress UspA family protein
MYKHMLLAADGSENAFRAAKEAVKIAKCTEDSFVEVVYVADFEKVRTEMLHAGSLEALEVNRRKKLLNIEQLFKNNKVDYKVYILHGTPGPEIIKHANELNVDLVIIGSRGLNNLQEMVLGSVSHKVMKRVRCPALIVK